jgi:hypothetical protein
LIEVNSNELARRPTPGAATVRSGHIDEWHTVNGDGVKQMLVDPHAVCRSMFALERDHGLEGFECLDRSLETDRSWFHAVFGCGLSDDRADEIVRQHVGPDFLPDKFRCFATQDVHLQRSLQ